jgi:tripartite-type tricarboxylate transporter receptor subunit TctC
VHWIVPFSPGGGTDIVARLIGQRLSERLGQPFVIENRPGGSANIGTEAVVHAPADGYTLLLAASVNAINATLHPGLDFDFIRDIAPVVGIMRVPNVMMVNPSLPARSIPEFIAYAKANPGRINMASAGTGTSQHVAGELFKIMAGVDMLHVPYRGTAPALADLLGGQVQVLFMGPATSMKYVKGGKLRALGVTSATRSPALPDLPAIAEFLPGFEATLFYGLGAPRGTPREIVDVLNREVNAALADPGIKARLADQDGTELGGSPADFGKLVADETEKWRRVIKLANIKAD